MPPRNPPLIITETLSRRSLLDWLGKATVLALGGEVLAACGTGDRAQPDGSGNTDGDLDPPFDGSADGGWDGGDGGDADRDGGGTDDADTPTDGAADADVETTPDWSFAPPEDPPSIYSDWPSRTVDRQDLVTILATWRLRIDGMVDRPVELSFADLLELTRQDQTTDFHCVEGWSVYDVPWNGVHLSTLLEAAGRRPEATYVTFHTIGGSYNESLPIDVALEPRTMLGYGVAEHTLPLSHGFPLRLVVPRLLGYKNAKYVDRIELTDERIEGFWVRLGYPYLGEVPEERLRPGRY